MTDNLPQQMHDPTTAVATVQPQNGDGFADLGVADVRLPRLKLAQMISKVVENDLVKYGDVFVAYGQEDMEPVVLAKAPKAQGQLGEEVIFYVLGVQAGYSYTDPNGGLGRTPDGSYPNLALVKGQDPRNVRRTYDYTLVIPAYPEVPVKFIMHGQWGGQSAKTLNTRLMLGRQKGLVPSQMPFRLQVRKAQNDKGSFAQAIIAPADVPAKDRAAHAALVSDFMEMINTANVVVDEDVPTAPAAPTDAPSLD